MKNTIANIFIKNYKFFYHIFGAAVLLAILWLFVFREFQGSELLGWLAAAVPFIGWANVRALKDSGLQELFDDEISKRGL